MPALATEAPPVAFVFITHHLAREILREYEKIEASVAGLGTAWFLYQGETSRPSQKLQISNLEIVRQSDLQALNYRMPFDSILPGSSHFPLLEFYRKHREYRDYWLIEYDVRFSGDWRTFFAEFASVRADFLAAHFRRYHEEPEWPFWALTHPVRSIALEDRMRCFHPICRLSNAALACISAAHQDGWCGHDELLPTTLLHVNGFSFADFGGEGEFVPPGMQNKYYTSTPPNPQGLLESGTYRFRPLHLRMGREKDKLYHPVKPQFITMRSNIRSLIKRILGKKGAAK